MKDTNKNKERRKENFIYEIGKIISRKLVERVEIKGKK